MRLLACCTVPLCPCSVLTPAPVRGSHSFTHASLLQLASRPCEWETKTNTAIDQMLSGEKHAGKRAAGCGVRQCASQLNSSSTLPLMQQICRRAASTTKEASSATTSQQCTASRSTMRQLHCRTNATQSNDQHVISQHGASTRLRRVPLAVLDVPAVPHHADLRPITGKVPDLDGGVIAARCKLEVVRREGCRAARLPVRLQGDDNVREGQR